MTEFASSPEHELPEPSPALSKIMQEIAQFYLLAQDSEFSIHEGALPDFKSDFSRYYRQHVGDYDEAQLQADYEAALQLLQAKGAETIIEEERAKRAEARKAQEAATQLGTSATGRFGFLGRRKK